MSIEVTPGIVLPDAELEWRFSRSSGPGGQKVNTSDTRVELSFDVARTGSLPEVLRARAIARLADRLVDGRLTVAASEHRSQWRNREAAASRLAAALRDAIRPPPAARRPTRPDAAARERRLAEKRRRADLKRGRHPPADAE